MYKHPFKNADSTHLCEVDFLFSKVNKIIPLEIKSSAGKSHTSMDEFCIKFSHRIKNGKTVVETCSFAQLRGTYRMTRLHFYARITFTFILNTPEYFQDIVKRTES